MNNLSVTCKHCGCPDLMWVNTPDGFRLYGAIATPSGFAATSDMHVCNAPHAKVAHVATKTATKKIFAKAKSAWYEKFEALIAADCRRILIVGPPGTGKSKTAQILSGAVRITLTEGDAISDMTGSYLLRKGETIWVDATPAACIRNDCPIIFDEINNHSPEVESFMYGACDDEPQMTLQNGDRLVAKSGYKVIATMNENISVLREALADRFEAVLLATSPHPDALADLDANLRNACNAYYRSLNQAPWEFSARPTSRRCRSYQRLLRSGYFEPLAAAELVFGKAGKEMVSALSTADREGEAK